MRQFTLLVLCGCLTGGLPAMAAAANSAPASALENAVKASYLTKFGPFVDWPSKAAARNDSPLTLCVVGEDPFDGLLEEAARGQRVNGHPLAVNRFRAVDRDAASSCHIMFIGAPADQSTGETLAATAGLPVLTVTDPSRGVSGGIIQFVLQSGRVRFQVDQARAMRSGLRISAKLLALSVKVGRQ